MRRRLIRTNYPGCDPRDCNQSHLPACHFPQPSPKERGHRQPQPCPERQSDKSRSPAATPLSPAYTPGHPAPTDAPAAPRLTTRRAAPLTVADLCLEELRLWLRAIERHLEAYANEQKGIRHVIRRRLNRMLLELLAMRVTSITHDLLDAPAASEPLPPETLTP